jgi:TatD DNase family protein
MFDTHCHLQTDAYDEDREQVLTEARAAGLKRFMVPAIDHGSFSRTLSLARSSDDIFCSLGIHPHSAKEWSSEIADEIRQAAGNEPKIRAIGEMGLDYYYDFAPKDVQRRAFSEQIALAQELRLPIVVHTRDSEDDVYSIVQEQYQNAPPDLPRGQFHCFSGDVPLMERAIALGFHVSFTGNITFKKSTLGEVVREVPLERMLLETDSPYLTPAPHRGKRNTPGFLRLIAEKVAEIKGIDIEVVMDQTYRNALKLFQISLWLLVLLAGGSLATADDVQAQPVGSRPPDSVMTPQRREAEELLRKQREELQREQEQRRQDSLQRVRTDAEQRRLEALEQVRQDSIKAAERIRESEEARMHALTPMPWKAIGVGAGAGIGNMAMSQSKATITPTSVLATTFQIGGHLTRSMDVELSFSNMRVGGDVTHDSLYANDLFAPVSPKRPNHVYLPGNRVPTLENLDISWISLDLRWVINPRAPLKFYAGGGYSHLTMTNHQEYVDIPETTMVYTVDPSKLKTYEQSFSRGAIKLLFGARYDFEVSSQFTVTPFAQIATLFAFQGEEQGPSFIFQPDRELITMTHLNIGVSVYFGWFGVPRDPDN